MMSGPPTYTELCQLDISPLAELLSQWRVTSDPSKITKYLEHGVTIEALPPQVVSTWLTIKPEVHTICSCMHNDDSSVTRSSAIKAFARGLGQEYAGDLWSAVGAVDGLLRWMEAASVNEVKLLSRQFGRLGTPHKNIDQTRLWITSLLKSIAYKHFPDHASKTQDARNLLEQQCQMLPACTEEFVEKWFTIKALPIPRMQSLIVAHPHLVQRRLLAQLLNEPTINFEGYECRKLLTNTPPTQSTKSGLSEPLRFAIQVLDELTPRLAVVGAPKRTNELLIQPILRGLLHRRDRIPEELFKQLVSKVLANCAAIPDLLEWPKSFLKPHTTVQYMVQLWAVDSERMRSSLCSIISAYSSITTDNIAILLRKVPVHLRMALLELLLKEGYRIDLQNLPAARRKDFTWFEEIFFTLPPADARCIVEPLHQYKLIRRLQHSEEHYHLKLDNIDEAVERLVIRLSRDVPGALDRANAAVMKARLKAEHTRGAEERAGAVKRVVCLAIASGSIALLHEVFLWLRRFNRDQTVLHLLYGSYLGIGDLPCLLSGFPKPDATQSDTEVSIAVVAANVKAGNRLVLLILESALLAVKEPDFNRDSWAEVFKMLGDIVTIRGKRLAKIKFTHRVTENELYHAVWEDTLETWMKQEEALLEDNSKPHFQSDDGEPRSIMMSVSLLYSRTPWHGSMLNFLDKLAQARNQLWTRIRRRRTPAVVDLDPVWPAGLPLQFLIPVCLKTASKVITGMPFVLQRAEAIIFRPRDVVNHITKPTDKAIPNAVGDYIEHYQSALQVWLSATPEGSLRDDQIRKAWTHAVCNFTISGTPESQAKRFWTKTFSSIVSVPSDLQQYVDPIHIVPLPHDEPIMAMEYNPQPDTHDKDSVPGSCALPYIEMLLEQTDGSYRGFGAAHEKRDDFSPSIIFDHSSPIRVNSTEREAYIAASLLLIEAKQCGRVGILAQSFPDQVNTRFPALFLDEQFLANNAQSETNATEYLRRFKLWVPPTLLSRLIHAREETRRSLPDRTSFQFGDYSMLQSLAKSDKPGMAISLITKFILDRPSESAWHRKILSRGILNNLRSQDVEKLLLDLTNEIIGRLSHQKARRTSPAQDDLDEEETVSDAQPLVKVTTVKMLANLLDNAPYISHSEGTGILTQLFREVEHIDMRAAIINSAVGIYVKEGTTSLPAETEEEIFRILDLAAVHVAGINELRPMSEADWLNAEQKHHLPEVPMHFINSPHERPIRTALVSVVSSLVAAQRLEEAARYVKRIILPMVDLSMRNHERWNRLFLLCHALDSAEASTLPSITVDPGLLGQLISDHPLLYPKEYLDKLERFASFSLQAPLGVKSIKVLAQNESFDPKGGMHWRHVWDHGRHKSCNFTAYLDRQFAEPGTGFITLQDMQRASQAQLDLLLALGSQNNHFDYHFEHTVPVLKPNPSADFDTHQTWCARQEPVLKHVLRSIDAMRTEAWQQDPKRSPDMLPDTIEYRLWLLPYPSTQSQEQDNKQRAQVFVQAVMHHLDDIAAADVPYHKAYAQIKAATVSIQPSKYDLTLVHGFGQLSMLGGSSQPLQTWLSIEIAGELLSNVAKRHRSSRNHVKYDHEEWLSVVALISRWCQSPIEGVREHGRVAQEYLRQIENLMGGFSGEAEARDDVSEAGTWGTTE